MLTLKNKVGNPEIKAKYRNNRNKGPKGAHFSLFPVFPVLPPHRGFSKPGIFDKIPYFKYMTSASRKPLQPHNPLNQWTMIA